MANFSLGDFNYTKARLKSQDLPETMPIPERHCEIYTDFINGMTLREIAIKRGMTYQNVWQFVDRTRRRIRKHGTA